MRPFSPAYGTNQKVTLAGASAVPINMPTGNRSFRVINSGSAILYFRMYSSSGAAPVASNTDCPVMPGGAFTGTLAGSHDRCSLYSLAGTTAEVMVGEGI